MAKSRIEHVHDFRQTVRAASKDATRPRAILVIALLVASANAGGAHAQRTKRVGNKQTYVAQLQQRLVKQIGWASNEKNGPPLWTKVRQSIDGILAAEWRGGKLQGRKVSDAYYVRCDRSTMTQNDIDNGRLICQVGVAPSRPAEFVAFRIRQNTNR